MEIIRTKDSKRIPSVEKLVPFAKSYRRGKKNTKTCRLEVPGVLSVTGEM